MRHVSLATTLAAGLLLGGCSLLVPKFETPQLSVVNVELQKSDLWEQRMKVAHARGESERSADPGEGSDRGAGCSGPGARARCVRRGVQRAGAGRGRVRHEHDRQYGRRRSFACSGRAISSASRSSIASTGKISLLRKGCCVRLHRRLQEDKGDISSPRCKPAALDVVSSPPFSSFSYSVHVEALPGAARRSPAPCRSSPCGSSAPAAHRGPARCSSPTRALPASKSLNTIPVP